MQSTNGEIGYHLTGVREGFGTTCVTDLADKHRPAAQYVRTLLGYGAISIEAQKITIVEYARRHGYEIVSIHADQGKSGLSLKGRSGLKQLLADALNRPCSFNAILLYDVSRWGRFYDPDEAAYYEFLCRRAGIPVVYCLEPSEDDFSPASGGRRTSSVSRRTSTAASSLRS